MVIRAKISLSRACLTVVIMSGPPIFLFAIQSGRDPMYPVFIASIVINWSPVQWLDDPQLHTEWKSK